MQSMIPAPGGSRAYLAAAEKAVRDFAGWHIAPVLEETLTLDGNGENSLRLPTLRIAAISAMSNEGEELDPETLEWSEAGFVRLPAGQRWTNRLRGVSVTLTHGIKDASLIIDTIRQMAARAEMSPTGAIREKAGMTELTPTMVAPNAAGGVVLMEHERLLLAPYRIGGGI
ncbi:hypothetical protein [Glutamicibacter sp. NPDC087583]|uniref:hypothetical protein n=1 Tax=Glutamicibacter sp. NPDC087583 TaxID=3363995 RepID=UPI0037FE35E4